MRGRWILLVPLLGAAVCFLLGGYLLQVGPDPAVTAAAFEAPPSPIARPPAGARPGSFFLSTLHEARRDGVLLALGAILLVATLVALVKPDARRRLRASVFFFGIYLASMPLCGAALAMGKLTPYGWTRTIAWFFLACNATNLAATLLFDVLLAGLRLPVRPIFRDLITGAAYLVVTFGTLSLAGVDLKPVLAGSALIGGLIGLSIQSTLADAVSGVILEWEDTVEVGDWVKIGDITGKVIEIRWRYLRVETRNWETVLFPNNVVTKSNLVILGRRQGKPLQHRRWLYVLVDYRHPPNEVIGLVNATLQNPIDCVASDPRPNCLLFDLRDHAALYAVRYWLTNLERTDSTDSVVRTRVMLALARAGITPAVPARDVRITTTDEAARAREEAASRETRQGALRRYGLFAPLTEAELAKVVAHLSHALFAKGEVMTRQGADANWLYLLVRGEARVEVQTPAGGMKAVARLVAPDYFGEMALLTGERRTASVMAESDCECWRLERQVFKEIVQARPEIADELSRILAARRVSTEHALAEGAPPSLAAEQRRVLDAISSFFGLRD
jgi:small-conductance mechanosensitive channel/CRP-like cAMP-binding protein